MSALQSSGYWYPQVRGNHADRSAQPATPLSKCGTQNAGGNQGLHGNGRNGSSRPALPAQGPSIRRILRQKDFASELEISNASVSALVDRLCRDGYAQRVVHPEDRRSVAIMPTKHTDQEVRETLGPMHQRMLEAVESLTADERTAAAKFLHGMIRSVEKIDTSTPTSPKAPSSSGTKAAATAHTAS